MLLPCRHPVDRVLRYRCCAARLLGLLNRHALFHSSSKRLPLLAGDLQFYSFHKQNKKRDSGGLGELGGLRCQWGSSSTRNERKKRKPSRVSSVKKRQIRDEVRPVLPPIG